MGRENRVLQIISSSISVFPRAWSAKQKYFSTSDRVSDTKTFVLVDPTDLSSYPLYLQKIQKTKILTKNQENLVLGRENQDFAVHFQPNFLIPQGEVGQNKNIFLLAIGCLIPKHLVWCIQLTSRATPCAYPKSRKPRAWLKTEKTEIWDEKTEILRSTSSQILLFFRARSIKINIFFY